MAHRTKGAPALGKELESLPVKYDLIPQFLLSYMFSYSVFSWLTNDITQEASHFESRASDSHLIRAKQSDSSHQLILGQRRIVVQQAWENILGSSDEAIYKSTL